MRADIVLVAVLASAGSGGMADQPSADKPNNEEAEEEVVATSTNFKSARNNRKTPVTVIDSRQLGDFGINSSMLKVLHKGAAAIAGRNSAMGGKDFVDFNHIPAVAIDRQQVLSEGASAFYGSNRLPLHRGGQPCRLLQRRSHSRHSDSAEDRCAIPERASVCANLHRPPDVLPRRGQYGAAESFAAVAEPDESDGHPHDRNIACCPDLRRHLPRRKQSQHCQRHSKPARCCAVPDFVAAAGPEREKENVARAAMVRGAI